MYVKTNTVLYKQKQMYNYYINTKNFLWIRCFTNGLTCQTEKTDCLPDYPYTPPFFRGGGGCVRWWYPLAIIVPVAPSDILQLPCSQSSFQKLYFDSTVPFLLISSDVYLLFTNKDAVTPPFTQRLNGDLQNCII